MGKVKARPSMIKDRIKSGNHSMNPGKILESIRGNFCFFSFKIYVFLLKIEPRAKEAITCVQKQL